MESKNLVKKQGKVPFTEHMTVSKYRLSTQLLTRLSIAPLGGESTVVVPESLDVNNDIKREVAL